MGLRLPDVAPGPSNPQSSNSLLQISTAASHANAEHFAEMGLFTTPYDTAMLGMCAEWWEGPVEGPGTGAESAPARDAPSVPDDSAKAVEELRPSECQIYQCYLLIS